MATKLELETENAELRRRLAEGGSNELEAKVASLAARVKELEDELDLGREAAGRLETELHDAEQHLSQAAKELERLRAKHTASLRELDESNARATRFVEAAKVYQDQLVSLQTQLDQMRAAGGMTGDHAVLDGMPWTVRWRGLIKWANLEYLRRFCDEDHTALILERHGE